MEDLLANQQELVNAIRKLDTNFRKDGAERKSNAEYFNRKLETLEGYWKEFENNHLQLSRYDIRDESYYINGDYSRTTFLYKALKEMIIKQREEVRSRVARAKSPAMQENLQPGVLIKAKGVETQQADDDEPAGGSMEHQQKQVSRGVTSKLDDMLRKQYVNFKAFSRTVANIDVDDINEKWEFEDTLKNLESRWSAIDSLHWEIETDLDGEASPYQGVFVMHEETYAKLKKNINKKMWAVSHREKSTPVMDIPIFAGNYNQWTSFKDLFFEAVHNNPSLSSAQKMQFLKSKLKGEAESLIRHMPVSTDNYTVCWEILGNRYNNKKLIFTSHMNLLLNVPNAQQPSLNHVKRLHDAILENLNAIKNLGVDTSTWDPILVYLLSQKLDSDTHTDYIESIKDPRELPNLQDFIRFLEFKFTTLEASRRKQEQPTYKTNTSKGNFNNFNSNNNNQKHFASYNNTKPTCKSTKSGYGFKCLLCKQSDHLLYQCKNFIDMPHNLKLKTVNQMNICKNCLFDHNGKDCISTKRCRNCKCRHHTLLHEAYLQTQPSTSLETQKRASNTTHVSQGCDSQVLLATALVHVTAANGSKYTMRALIDQGSQISLITENAAQMLGIKRKGCSGVVYGIGQKQNNSKGVISIECSSLYSEFSFNTEVLVMNSLIKNLPTQSFTKPAWPYLNGVQLADPEFNVSRRVDILFGAEIYSLIMLGGILKGEDSSLPIIQQTHLGWILCGSMTKTFHCNVLLNNINDIKKFWEVEDIEDESELSSEDYECVRFYTATTERRRDGRYVVRLPMKTNEVHRLGSSKNIAVAQFFNLERKLIRQEQLASQYKNFITEYRELGHMKLCDRDASPTSGCYLPHHCVQQPGEGNVNKFRVVFNASAKTSTGVSLNDIMLRGPNLQKDLQSLIIKWRQYQYVVTADIEKMYRQIIIKEDDQVFQKIIWRDEYNEQIKSYQLTTITYGLKAAPFLAMMTLRQLAEDERERFPKTSKVLQEDLFMDDLLTGSHSIQEGQELVKNLNELLELGGCTLRKWASNYDVLLESVAEDRKRKSIEFNFKSEATKTLGLSWNIGQDSFTFEHQLSKDQMSKPTKRILLSEISKIFDPLGWLSPVVVSLKLLFQDVWKAELDWSDPIPDNIFLSWTKLRADIDNISRCKIPRWIGSCEGDKIQLHGFCDASLRAYACVIYARIQREDKVSIVLVAAKTKLVPQAKNITLPRLELSGAHLLVKLMEKVILTLPNYKKEVFGWSDSKVVLCWLQGDPGRWKPFISNRVKFITQTMPTDCWSYVKSSENPADYASRGQLASQLCENTLWWEGPAWLVSFQRKQEQQIYTTDIDKRGKASNALQVDSTEPSIINKLLLRHSSITKIISIVAWILRAANMRRKQLPTYLTLQELNKAKLLIIKYVQGNEFTEDVDYLNNYKTIKLNSKLLNLNPFIDRDGILKVGGRLEKSQLKEETKHPAILPHSSRLTTLIIEEAHKHTFHGGARLTATWIRQKYWILGGNRAVKKQIRNCVTCRKHNPQHQYQLMGDLPKARTTRAPPFYHTGVDLTGFVDVKASRGRGIKTCKGYIVLFVCMVTKAVHIELVSDLTSAAFLSALRRMAARRGAPHHMYSDNGTNFIKGNRNIQEEYFELQQIINKDFLKDITEMNIEWHFQAPRWPSASGLQERGIRSIKAHLKPVIGEQKLTFEEYSTLLAQIEACLNSRPLCALTEDPDDLEVLTPAHFLTCRADLTVVETEKDARTRWQLVRKLLEDIWKRWKAEYVTQLTVRSKWLKRQRNIKIGDIVCIHEDLLPPGKWAMGRVTEVHPGEDGIVRVVTLKTKNGYTKRPVLKLSVLPVHQGDETGESTSINEATSAVVTSVKKSKFTSILTTLLYIILFMNIVTTARGEFHVNPLNQNQSLYFDKISNMQIIRDEWKLVVYYEMDPFWQGCFALQTYIKHLNRTCVMLNYTSHCDMILGQLRHGYSELQYYNQMLLTQHSSSRSRQRRGLIDGVGYLSNYLFGILDERFAEQYQRDISQIRTNQKYLAGLWKNQTSIVEAEYNLLKRTEETMAKQHESIHRNLNTLNGALVNLATKVNQNNDFSLEALAASNMLNNLKDIQDMLLDQITDIYHGKFTFHLVAPEQLLHELSIISTQISSELSLPIDNVQSDMSKIYSLLKIKTRMLKEYLIFEIRIPLINRDTYELYQLIPIPHETENNVMVTLIPKSEQVAINLRKDTYIVITYQQTSECLRHESDTYLCYLQSPINKLRGDYDLCEVADDTRTCRLITAPCNNRWVNLNLFNTYLYFCCNQCNVRVHCGVDQVTSYQLARAGIAASDDCMIKTDDTIIYAHKLRQPKIVHMRPRVIVTDVPPINRVINLSIPWHDMTDSDSKDRKESLAKIDQDIQHIQKQADLAEVSIHDIHHYVAIYLLLVAVSIAGAVLAWRRVRRRWDVTGGHPRALPRHNVQGPPASNEGGTPERGTNSERVKCDRCDVYSEVNESARKCDRGTVPDQHGRVFK